MILSLSARWKDTTVKQQAPPTGDSGTSRGTPLLRVDESETTENTNSSSVADCVSSTNGSYYYYNNSTSFPNRISNHHHHPHLHQKANPKNTSNSRDPRTPETPRGCFTPKEEPTEGGGCGITATTTTTTRASPPPSSKPSPSSNEGGSLSAETASSRRLHQGKSTKGSLMPYPLEPDNWAVIRGQDGASIHVPVRYDQFYDPKPWISENYEDLGQLSNAIHGEVRLMRSRAQGKAVVVKVIRRTAVRPRAKAELENPLMELGSLLYLFSKREGKFPPMFVAEPEGVYETKLNVYLVMEYCSGGELFHEVVRKKHLSERVVKIVGLQLAFGLLSLHSNGIVHRDISLENTLLLKDRTIRLIDFGQVESAYTSDGRFRLLTGTTGKAYYRAPEMFTAVEGYTGPPADIFALGILLFIMAVGSPPWQTASPTDEGFQAIKKEGLEKALVRWNRRRLVSDALLDLLYWMLESNPARRPTIQEVFLHPWLAHDVSVWKWLYRQVPYPQIKQQRELVDRLLRRVPEGVFYKNPVNGVASTASTSAAVAAAAASGLSVKDVGTNHVMSHETATLRSSRFGSGGGGGIGGKTDRACGGSPAATTTNNNNNEKGSTMEKLNIKSTAFRHRNTKGNNNNNNNYCTNMRVPQAEGYRGMY